MTGTTTQDRHVGLAITIVDQVAEDKGGWGNPDFETYLQTKVDEALSELQMHVEDVLEVDFYNGGTLKVTDWEPMHGIGVNAKCKRVFWAEGVKDPDEILIPAAETLIDKATVRKDI